MKNSNGKKRPGDVGRRHREFLERHRQYLLRYLDGEISEGPVRADALGYVASVLTEWHEQFADQDIVRPDARERTFWFTLYQLEELAELGDFPACPFRPILRQGLEEAREMLRHRQPLPLNRFMATRPDGA